MREDKAGRVLTEEQGVRLDAQLTTWRDELVNLTYTSLSWSIETNPPSLSRKVLIRFASTGPIPYTAIS